MGSFLKYRSNPILFTFLVEGRAEAHVLWREHIVPALWVAIALRILVSLWVSITLRILVSLWVSITLLVLVSILVSVALLV
jgi:hypothetical protein